ncbi:hypothetical protein [Streptomyces sp. NBC_01294]|uniref:hypothetical protein n=1 Tax=Streptomyces sp. NBC_01294 TaxID=2903815 RepID=UPI002DD7A4D8|nr:hypothetical protein [Streptomyces sp. NBC_01294]WRZ61540.1 hypothetical protein OG534_36765 [Streptomyces sp. NBC_01294]
MRVERIVTRDQTGACSRWWSHSMYGMRCSTDPKVPGSAHPEGMPSCSVTRAYSSSLADAWSACLPAAAEDMRATSGRAQRQAHGPHPLQGEEEEGGEAQDADRRVLLLEAAQRWRSAGGDELVLAPVLRSAYATLRRGEEIAR